LGLAPQWPLEECGAKKRAWVTHTKDGSPGEQSSCEEGMRIISISLVIQLQSYFSLGKLEQPAENIARALFFPFFRVTGTETCSFLRR